MDVVETLYTAARCEWYDGVESPLVVCDVERGPRVLPTLASPSLLSNYACLFGLDSTMPISAFRNLRQLKPSATFAMVPTHASMTVSSVPQLHLQLLRRVVFLYCRPQKWRSFAVKLKKSKDN
jgi:hypothetical protein